jgi:hypothetical protein
VGVSGKGVSLQEIIFQKKGKSAVPFSQEDLEKFNSYKDNQLLRSQVYGIKKPRSLKQLRGYWAACNTTAENNEAPGWQTKKQVDFQCRVALRFYDPDLIVAKPDGSIAFSYRSISFKNLAHIEACGYFNGAFELMADKLRITVEELLSNSR